MDFAQIYFMKNKYTRCYFRIISQAINAQRARLPKGDPEYIYYEEHHIVPKSMASDLAEEGYNLVLLTAREHFICHCLLTKMTYGNDTFKMYNAFKMMCGTKGDVRYVNSRLYEAVRKNMHLSPEHKQKIALAGTGRKHSQSTRAKMSASAKGKPKSEAHKQKLRDRIVTDETRQKLSKALTGKTSNRKGKPGPKASDETKQKMSEAHQGENNHFYGKNHSDKTKQKMKEAWSNEQDPRRQKYVCPHCAKSVAKSMFVRWHGNNCKSIS